MSRPDEPRISALEEQGAVKKISLKAARMRRQPQQARSQERVERILDVAEQLFVEVGYKETTTRAIASRAEIPVGSLYQFFPDKEAILKAIATRTLDLLYQIFQQFHEKDAELLTLADYVDRVIDSYDQFFRDRPGYHATYMRLMETMTASKLLELGNDPRFTQELAAYFARRNPNLDVEKCEMIATVFYEAIDYLLWVSISRNEQFRASMVAETKKLALAYLQIYLNP